MLKNEDKNKYYSYIRWEIIKLVDGNGHSILDVGCGNGSTLLKLKELGKAKYAFGIEINESLSKKLTSDLDGCIIGNIETVKPQFDINFFDYIIFADVLEHLADPGKILNSYLKYLKEDGYILASIPNIKFFSILLKLVLLDEFTYTDAGILDRTHLRFFTKKEIRNLFKKENLEVVSINPKLCEPFNTLDNLLFNLIGKLPLTSFLTVQYLIKVKKYK